MRSIALVFGLALSLFIYAPRGEQLPLVTVEGQTCCLLSYSVVDVVAHPKHGAVEKGSHQPLRWPAGYTAWRVGSEVEVRAPGGWVVLRTPGRYRINPTWPDRVVGDVQGCPDCELGGGPL